MMRIALWSGLALALALQASPSGNMIVNGDATRGTAGWKTHGVALTERIGGVACFTVRSAGQFDQEIKLPVDSVGMFAAVVGKGQTDRVNADGSITGLPSLYGMVATADRMHFLAYWQGQNMLGRTEQPGQWVTMSGVFSVPYGASYVSIQLHQAERKDSPQDGSAARFRNVRMQLFTTEEAAHAFIAQYK